MRCTAPSIHCHLLRSGTAARLCCAPWPARHWGRGYCAGKRRASRQRELVTGGRSTPNSSLEAHKALRTMMEPDHVDKTPSHDFPPAAAAGVLCNGPCGLDHIRQELLAERGQAEHAIRNRWFARRYLRVRPGRTTSGARGESDPRWIGNALSGRPEVTLKPAVTGWVCHCHSARGCGGHPTSATPLIQSTKTEGAFQWPHVFAISPSAVAGIHRATRLSHWARL